MVPHSGFAELFLPLNWSSVFRTNQKVSCQVYVCVLCSCFILVVSSCHCFIVVSFAFLCHHPNCFHLCIIVFPCLVYLYPTLFLVRCMFVLSFVSCSSIYTKSSFHVLWPLCMFYDQIFCQPIFVPLPSLFLLAHVPDLCLIKSILILEIHSVWVVHFSPLVRSVLESHLIIFKPLVSCLSGGSW